MGVAKVSSISGLYHCKMEYTQDNYADQDSVISQPFNPQSSELLFCQ
jgi:hypothetical protein